MQNRGQRSVEGNGFTYLGFNSYKPRLCWGKSSVLQPPQQKLSWTRVGMGRKGTNPAPPVWVYLCVDLPSGEAPPGAQVHALSRLGPRVLTSVAPVPAPVATDKSLQIDG